MTGFDLPPISGFDMGMPQRAMKGLQNLEGFQGPEGLQGPEREGGAGSKLPAIGDSKPFSGVLADSLEHVADLKQDVRDKVRGMVMGEDVALHDVLIASGKSEVAFNLMLEVRNKMVDAWEKLSRSSG